MEATSGYANSFPKVPNGKINGKANGKMNGKMNGQAVTVKRRTTPKRGPTLLARSFNMIARILTWYSIVSVLFRCPANLEACDESSPKICKPYFQLKHAVTPHLEPYYHTYAAPYVEKATPYYNIANERVFVPTKAYAVKYGAPRLQQAQTYGKAQWDKNIHPKLAVYQKQAQDKYDQTVAPHVAKASTSIGPYYDIARTSALQTYHDVILPSYHFVHPYAAQGYAVASHFTTETAVPSAYWAWNKTYSFLDATVWPQFRVLYIENVEPQLARIGQRLGRYKNKTKGSIENVSESAAAKASSFTKPVASTASTVASSVSSAVSSASDKASTAVESAHIPDASEVAQHDKSEQVQPPPPDEDADELREKAQETVAKDLSSWQDKFAKAADEGASEIEDRVEEISKRVIKEKAHGEGKALVAELQNAAITEVNSLQKKIIELVQKSVESPEGIQDELFAAVRKAGLNIKEKAQKIRAWKEDYEAEIEGAVSEAADSHFKILESIQDLALQKIGMKWAWMDGITYKDWAKYHELRERFEVWTNDLKKLIVTHPGLQEAREASNEVEDSGMAAAQAAAQELAKLKQVGLWKLAAQDSSDNFDSETARLAAEEAERLRATEPSVTPSDAVSTPEEDPLESAASVVENESPATELASDGAASSVSSVASEVKESLSSGIPVVSSAVSESATSAASQASSVAVGSSSSTASGPDLASTIIPGDDQTYIADTEGSSPAGAEESAVPGDKLEEEIILESAEDKPVAADTETVKPAFLGAAAQSVSNRVPVMDDDEDADSVSSRAQEAYSAAVSKASAQYSSASAVISAKIYGTPQPTQEKLIASASGAYAEAIAAASSRYDEAIKAASKAIYGTVPAKPTPSYDWARVEAIASQRLNEGRLWAEQQYESAKIALGLATATPTSQVEKLLDQAKYNYYAGVGVAHARYSEFLAAASSALNAATATPTPTNVAGTASSVASVATRSADAVASGAQKEALAVASAVSDGFSAAASIVSNSVSAGVQEVVDAAQAIEKGVSDTWEAVVSRASVQIYGKPTPTAWYDSAGQYASQATAVVAESLAAAQNRAVKQYEDMSKLVSELLVGKEPTYSESVLARLQAAYSTGIASAASLASAASATVSSAASAVTDAVKETVRHARDEL